MMETCRCCQRRGRDVKVWIRIKGGPRGNPLCRPCWDDPAASFAECSHGLAPHDRVTRELDPKDFGRPY